MSKIDKTLAKMRASPVAVTFAELEKVCEHYFGPPRARGGSHHVYVMPWPGDPRVNIQNRNGMAKAYQVRQALKAIEKLQQEAER
jgi:hypothetical protein